MLGLLWMTTAAWADCSEPSTPGEVAAAARAVEDAFVALDLSAFEAATADLALRSGCISAPLSPEQAARVHTAGALAAFLEEDEVRTIAAFQAALAAQPELELADGIDRGHPIRMEVRLAEKLPRNPAKELEPADGESLLIDGHLSNQFVPEQPILVQRLRGEQVVDSALVSMGTELPTWAPLAPERLPPEVRRRIWIGGTSLVSTTTALTAWAIAFRSHQDFLSEETNYLLLPQLEDRANLFSNVAVASGIVAAGTGLTVVILW